MIMDREARATTADTQEAEKRSDSKSVPSGISYWVANYGQLVESGRPKVFLVSPRGLLLPPSVGFGWFWYVLVRRVPWTLRRQMQHALWLFSVWQRLVF